MRSGRLRDRVKILKQTTERNDFGELLDEYCLVAEKYCETKVISDNESSSNRTGSTETLEFTTRYSKQIEKTTSDMFIEFEGCYYDIVSVIDYRRLKKRLIIKAVLRS